MTTSISPTPASIQSDHGSNYPSYPYQPISAAPAAPAASTRSGLPWFIAGATLLTIAICHLMLLPEWIATKTSDGVVGNLTGVVAEVGIGAALLAVGFTRRRHQR